MESMLKPQCGAENGMMPGITRIIVLIAWTVLSFFSWIAISLIASFGAEAFFHYCLHDQDNHLFDIVEGAGVSILLIGFVAVPLAVCVAGIDRKLPGAGLKRQEPNGFAVVVHSENQAAPIARANSSNR
jgi:hypothetical protein